MKIKLLIGIVFIFVLSSCRDNPWAYKENLTGYWEIEKVYKPSEDGVSYPVNTVIDYIEVINDTLGIRKKMYPSFDGTYRTQNYQTDFILTREKEQVFINYSNKNIHWKEELMSIDKNHFSVRNEQGIEYYYKRYEPLTIKDL